MRFEWGRECVLIYIERISQTPFVSVQRLRSRRAFFLTSIAARNAKGIGFEEPTAL